MGPGCCVKAYGAALTINSAAAKKCQPGDAFIFCLLVSNGLSAKVIQCTVYQYWNSERKRHASKS